MIHKHHIIPKHAGGGNEPSNIKKLTLEEHALEHKKLYKKYKRPEDKIAWLALSGQISKQETVVSSLKVGREKTNLLLKQKYGKKWRSIISQKGQKALKEKIKKNKKFAQEMLEIWQNNLKLATKAACSEQSRNKRLNTFKKIKHQQGAKNSQHSTMWITNFKISKKIKKTDKVPDGWIKGRIIKVRVSQVAQPVS
jgi:hypothetical protein